MKSKDAMMKEKEKVEKLKALRKELEAELEEQLILDQEKQAGLSPQVQSVDTNQELEPERAKQVIEAMLFASSKPVTVAEIKKVVRGSTPKQIETIIESLKQEYEASNRSFEILSVAGGFEVATKKDFAPWVMKIELQKKVRQATQSALETLAILAYKQPITRAEIEELRGVDSSGVLNTLAERNFIKIVGKKEVPGRPFLYGTTDKFLEHFGLNSLNDLPNIEEIRTVVESSVKKEDLLRKNQVIPMDQETEVGTTEESGEGPAPETGENTTDETQQEKSSGSEPTA